MDFINWCIKTYIHITFYDRNSLTRFCLQHPQLIYLEKKGKVSPYHGMGNYIDREGLSGHKWFCLCRLKGKQKSIFRMTVIILLYVAYSNATKSKCFDSRNLLFECLVLRRKERI